MLEIVVITLAVSGVLSAIDEFLPAIRKYRAVVALGGAIGAYLSIDTYWVWLCLQSAAVTFTALVTTLLISKISDPEIRSLPKRVPRR